jgi:hypothetical protein
MATLTLLDAFLKERYTDPDEVENLVKADRPLWAELNRDENCSGRTWNEPIIAGNPQGLGATRAKAQAGMNQAGAGGGGVLGYEWALKFGDYTASVPIDEKAIRAMKDDPGAFFRATQLQTDGLWEGFNDVMCTYLYSNGGQACGTGTISSGVITLADKESVVNFAIGQILVASANDGSDVSHTLLGSGSQGFVIALDQNAGTVTVSATSGGSAGTPASWTGTMFFFRDGDFGGSGATAIFKGLGFWLPSAAVGGSDSAYGVNRSVNQLLQGVRLTAAETTNVPIDQRLKRLGARMKGRFGGPGPDRVYLNPERWQDLADLLESRGTRPLDGKIGTLNFSYLQMSVGGNTVKIYADRFCPLARAFALRMKNWNFRSYGPVPDVLNGDGFDMLRQASADTYEYRLVAYPVFSTNAPSYNGSTPV